LIGAHQHARSVWLARWFLCLCLLASIGSAALAETVQPRGYFVDTSSQLSLHEVKDQVFEPLGRALSLGYTADTVWLRLYIDPDSVSTAEDSFQSQQFVLRITNPLLNDVRLYDSLQNGGEPIITGDAHPNTQAEIDLSSLTFLIPKGDEPRYVYVSVSSTSSMVFSVVLSSLSQAIENNRTFDLFAGIYLGLLVVFFVLALALRLGRADRVTNMFLIQQALAIVWSLSLMGYTRQYIGPWIGLQSVDGFINVIIVAYTFSVCQYGLVFLSQFLLRRWARALVYSPILVFMPLLLLVLLGYDRWALSLNALSVIAFSVLGLVIVLMAIDWSADSARALPRWLVTFFFVLFGFATPLATSVTLRFEPLFLNAFVGFFFTTGLGGLLMSTLLLYRARAQTRQAVATATAYKLQQQRSQEQAKFLGMLAHEFKTPLSIIKMVTGSGQLDDRSSRYSFDAIRNIDALLEKCLQAESLIDAPLRSASEEVDLQALIEDVSANSLKPELVDRHYESCKPIRSDPALVRIVLANLIDNAQKYGKPQAPIHVVLDTTSTGDISLRVTNSMGAQGVIDPVRVFDKYYRSPSALSQSGSGLGLYLSKHIAHVLGGELLMHLYGDVVTFELRLPGALPPA